LTNTLAVICIALTSRIAIMAGPSLGAAYLPAMGEVLGIGISHYPLFSALDRDMAMILRETLADPGIPAEEKDPKNWPPEMLREWGDDEGVQAAQAHREAMLVGLRRVRWALDAFRPDVVIIWGDDQYENFQEDVVPAFCIGAYEGFDVKPWAHVRASGLMHGKPNVWNEPAEAQFVIPAHREAGKHFASELLRENFDVAYAYKQLHHPGLPHAFLNAVLYLDFDRKGFPYPIVPFQINCYGRKAISYKGYASRFADAGRPPDPPSPSPQRCFDLGAAVARIARAAPWRVALVASSSWSHAFLVDKTWRLRPDIDSDRRLYEALQSGDYAVWRSTTLDEVEDAGQQEMLNWFALIGSMSELGRRCSWSDKVETNVFNSTKVAAIFEP
jgi:hypothetical protein